MNAANATIHEDDTSSSGSSGESDASHETRGVDHEGYTVLMQAAKRGDAEAVRALLRRPQETARDGAGANAPSTRASHGHSDAFVVDFAKQPGASGKRTRSEEHTRAPKRQHNTHDSSRELELEGSHAMAVGTNSQNTHLRGHGSYRAGRHAALYDINSQDTHLRGHTALIVAAEAGHTACVKLLIAAEGVRVNQSTRHGATPLYAAVFRGHSEAARALLAAPHIDPNQPNLNGATPLLVAAQQGHAACIETLCTAPGIDPNQAAANGITPLIAAALKGHTLCVHALLRFGNVHTNQVSRTGASPLFMAAQNGHSACVEALLAIEGVCVNQAKHNGATPLFIAAQQGHTACVQALLAHTHTTPGTGAGRMGVPGAAIVDVNFTMADGASPLFVAAQNGHLAIVQALLATATIDANPMHTRGRVTPLLKASYMGNVHIARALLLGGGCRFAKTEDGQTVTRVAKEKKHDGVVLMLLTGVDYWRRKHHTSQSITYYIKSKWRNVFWIRDVF